MVLKSTYKDNNFLDEDYKATLEGYKETDPYYYSVYCLGEWGVLGQTIFDAQKVSQRLQEIEAPIKRGEFVFDTWYSFDANEVLIDDSSIRWVESESGPIQIYQEPKEERSYVIGADTAGEGSDFNVGQVIDHLTGEQVCTIRGQMDEDLFAKQLYCLGKRYNTALVSIEAQLFQLSHPGAGAAALPQAVCASGGGQLYPPDPAELWLQDQQRHQAFGDRRAGGGGAGTSGVAQRPGHLKRNADLCPQRKRQAGGPGGRS